MPDINVNVNQSPLTEHNLPEKFKPIGMWKYFWLEVLFSIPVIGLIFTIIFACGGSGNVNVKYFARSRFCVLILVLIIAGIAAVIVFAQGGLNYIQQAQYINSLH